jgi:hypothetical protein
MPARKVEPPDGFESLADAARRRGVSERTLRRQIEAGIVPAEMFQRPQGSVWFVPLPETEAAETRRSDGSAANDSESAKGGEQAAESARFLIEVMSEHLKIKDARSTINGAGPRADAHRRAGARGRPAVGDRGGRQGPGRDDQRPDPRRHMLRGELHPEQTGQRAAPTRRAHEAEAELERLKARSWWDTAQGLRGR